MANLTSSLGKPVSYDPSEIPTPIPSQAGASTGSWGLVGDGQDDTPVQWDKSKCRASDTGDLEHSGVGGAPAIDLTWNVIANH